MLILFLFFFNLFCLFINFFKNIALNWIICYIASLFPTGPFTAFSKLRAVFNPMKAIVGRLRPYFQAIGYCLDLNIYLLLVSDCEIIRF